MKLNKYITVFFTLLFTVLLTACGTTSQIINEPAEEAPLEEVPLEPAKAKHDKDTITLLFAGDIMAHSVNYYITSYEKIWRDVRDVISEQDLPLLTLKPR